MQGKRLPPEIERLVLFFTGGFLAYLIMGASFVERCIGETALGVRTWEYTHFLLAALTGVFFAGATEYLYVFYKKKLNNTSDDSLAPRRRTRAIHDTEHIGTEINGWVALGILGTILVFLILIGMAQLVIKFPWIWPM